MSMSGNLSDGLLYDMLKKLSGAGQYAEIFLENSNKQAAVYENNQLDRVENSTDSGISFRVIEGDKTFFGYTNSFAESNIKNAVSELVNAVKIGEMRDIALNDKKSVKYFTTPADTDIQDKIKLVTSMDKAGRIDKKIIQFTSMYAESVRETRILNTEGCDISQSLCYVTGYAAAVASSGKEIQQAYIPLGGTFGAEEAAGLDFIKVSKDAAELAMKNLSAKYAPSGVMTVVIASSAGGTMVHEAVGHGLEADLACNGMSVYAGQIGKKVAAGIVSVADNGTLSGKRGSFLYDDEGVQASSNMLIENGILKKYMSDRLYGLKEGTELTGNGRRQSYRFRPIVRMTNTIIMPGSDSPDGIIKSVQKGLYVTRMGGGQVNTVTGDFVFEVTEGFLIENGKLGEPVKNATLIGNGPKVMREIDMIGDDLGFGIGTCGKEGQGVPVSDAQPTLRIPEITVGGR
ncbi:MAG: TldD/PmbA family protein [Denitrovibrio sp.]|nr:MAG: TldD/PmbA family protein [Denitrovibrio sp.]